MTNPGIFGPATPARAIGANGTVYTADSAQPGGARWGVAPAPGPTYNLLPQNLKYLRRGIARVRAGTGPMKLFCIGDSTTAGNNASAFGKNYPSQLTNLLNTYYVPAAQTWMFPHSASTAPTLDSRVTIGTHWSDNGGTFWQNDGTSGTLTFAPSGGSCYGPASTDTFDIYSFNGASFSASINGGTATVWTAPGPGNAITKTTMTCAAGGSNSLVITAANSGFILAVNAYSSTVPQVQIGNHGINSVFSGGYAASGNSCNAGFYSTHYAPDVAIVDLGINDSSTPVSTAQFQANIQTLITAQAATGDTILKSMVPSSGKELIETGYVAALSTLSTLNSVPFLDIFNRWGALWAPNNTLGYYGTPGSGDTTHPGDFGYADEADAVFNLLRTV